MEAVFADHKHIRRSLLVFQRAGNPLDNLDTHEWMDRGEWTFKTSKEAKANAISRAKIIFPDNDWLALDWR